MPIKFIKYKWSSILQIDNAFFLKEFFSILWMKVIVPCTINSIRLARTELPIEMCDSG